MVKADGEKTYFAADAAYYLDKRARGFDTCIYMLGADHHGYIGRLRALAACAGDDPDIVGAGADRPAGQAAAGRRGTQDVQAGRHHRHARGPGRAGRRRRGAVHPRAVLDRLASWSSTSRRSPEQAPENPVYYVQYVAARTASVAANAARPRARLVGAGVLPARAARATTARRAARRPRRVPAGGRLRGRAARAAPHRAVPGGAGRGLPPVLRRLPDPAARRGRASATCTSPGSGSTTPPAP